MRYNKLMNNENNPTMQDQQLIQDLTKPNQELPTTVFGYNQKTPKRQRKALLIIVIIVLLSVACIWLSNLIIDSHSTAKKYDRIINSSSSKEEAKQAVEKEFNNMAFGTSNTVTKNELIEETEYYYGLDVSWDYNDGNRNRTYNKKVISFKKSTYDYEYTFSNTRGKTVLANKMVTKDKDKIKTILDAIYKIKYKEIDSFKWINSWLNETTEEYIYELRYQETIGGDWGVSDKTITVLVTQSIDKSTGEINSPKTKEE